MGLAEHLPLEQGLRLREVLVAVGVSVSRRASSIRTRIKTVSCEVMRAVYWISQSIFH